MSLLMLMGAVVSLEGSVSTEDIAAGHKITPRSDIPSDSDMYHQLPEALATAGR